VDSPQLPAVSQSANFLFSPPRGAPTSRHSPCRRRCSILFLSPPSPSEAFLFWNLANGISDFGKPVPLRSAIRSEPPAILGASFLIFPHVFETCRRAQHTQSPPTIPAFPRAYDPHRDFGPAAPLNRSGPSVLTQFSFFSFFFPIMACPPFNLEKFSSIADFLFLPRDFLRRIALFILHSGR